MAERPTFSPFWHRVRAMKPRLRPHVEVTRQHYRGRRWHVVHDPASNQFYRLNPITHDFVGMLDGARDVESAWKLSLSKFGDAAPTQNEIIQLLSQLYNANLMTADAAPETEQLLRRGRERLKKKIQQQLIGIMYFRIRIFNPDRYLSALEPIFRPLINRWGFVAWCVLLGAALAAITRAPGAWERLFSGFESAISPSNWGWLAAVFVVTKAIHETGHGLICRRFGGQVPEFGLMLLVLFPSPYVDASSCWAFPSKWRRMAVGAGGMIFELVIAAAAAFVWLNTSGEDLIHQLAYNAMLTSGISTVLFNANPLMRFDGYYILADLLEVPNLAQRSMKMLQYLMLRYVYRLERVTAPSSLRGEQAILITYGLLSMAYRIFLFFSITLYIMGRLFAIGLVLAIWTAAAWFLLPTGAFIHWHAASPMLSEHRKRTIAISAVLVAVVILGIGAIPAPDHRRAAGVVESTAVSGVFVLTDGFVVDAPVQPGAWVNKGDPVLIMDSPDLVEARRDTLARLDQVEIERRTALESGQPAIARIAEERAEVFRDTLKDLDRRLGDLLVRAPQSGVVVRGDPERLIGAFLKEGSPLCEIVDTTSVRIVGVLEQTQGNWLSQLSPDEYRIQMRFRSDAATVIDGRFLEVIPAGQQQLPHESLGFKGGGQIETEPDSREGLLARHPRFVVRLNADFRPDNGQAARAVLPGERVKVRFTLPSKPLLTQWVDRLRKILQGRINV